MSANTASGFGPKTLGEVGRRLDGVRGQRWEIHGETAVAAGHLETAALGLEGDRIGVTLKMVKHDVGAGEGRVTAQIDLGQRREPAERVSAVSRHEKRGLRQVVLVRDGLQRGIVEPGFQGTHGSRIAAEHRIGERIDLEYLQAHATVY